MYDEGEIGFDWNGYLQGTSLVGTSSLVMINVILSQCDFTVEDEFEENR